MLRSAPVRLTLLVLLPAALVVACGGSDELEVPADVGTPAAAGAPANPLAGTFWRLVELQSMDDSIGTRRPEDPSAYTMRLNADGSVAMQLNCNRGTGTWKTEPGADGMSGTFTFGPMAMTRALCPPPSLDEQLARESEFVRGFLLRDGRLSLSLMADGGIQIWEPNPDVPFTTDEDAELEAAILRAVPDYTPEMVNPGTGPARYIYGRTDLNDDGREEVLVYLLGSIFCGSGGCDLLILNDRERGYAQVASLSIARTPVVVAAGAENGWRTIFKMESGGGAAPSWVRYTFDGSTYVEQDRVSGETPPDGMRHLAGAFTFQDGLVLEPIGG